MAGKHVVFGKVVKGFETIVAISKMPVDDKDRPLSLITIQHCGELERKGASDRILPAIRRSASRRTSLLAIVDPADTRDALSHSCQARPSPLSLRLLLPLALRLALPLPLALALP